MKANVRRSPNHISRLAAMLLAHNSGAQSVNKVAGGEWHTLLIKRDGSLWMMGANDAGQLGDGTYGGTFGSTNLPESIVASNAASVAGGGGELANPLRDGFGLFLKNDGSLWAMGDNSYGQLGDGTYKTITPYGTNSPEQVVASNITAIAAGVYHGLFVKNDGSLWGMGNNAPGQLGDGTYDNTNWPAQIVASNVSAVAAG